MAPVKELLHDLARRLACSPFNAARLVIATTGAAGASPGAQRIVGSMLPLALGQAGAPPEWIRLIPPGTFSTNDGRGPFVNANPDQVIANTKAFLGGRDAPADYDHLSEYVEKTGRPAIAAGWIKDWRVVEGAIEARVDWTAAAAAAISAKEYRYVSPVFATDKQGKVIQVFGFALVNRPALDLPAIAAAQRNDNQETNVLSKLIAQVLGLPETSTDADLVTAVTTAKKNFDAVIAASGAKASDGVDVVIAAFRDRPDPAKWIAASEHQKLTTSLGAVTAERDTLARKVAGDDTETVIAAAIKDGKLVPAQKEYWTKICASAGSAEPLREYLKSAPVVLKPGSESHAGRRPAASETGETQVITAAQLNRAEKEHCRQHGIPEESYARELTRLGVRPLAA